MDDMASPCLGAGAVSSRIVSASPSPDSLNGYLSESVVFDKLVETPRSSPVIVHSGHVDFTVASISHERADFLTVDDAVCSSSVRLVQEDPGLLSSSSSFQLCSTSVTGGQADVGSIVLSSSLSPTASLVDVDHGAACTRISCTRGLIVCRLLCHWKWHVEISHFRKTFYKVRLISGQRASQKSRGWSFWVTSKWPERVSTIPKKWAHQAPLHRARPGEDRLVCNVSALSDCVTFGMECPSFGRPCFLCATIAAGSS